ncbi:MAG: hypothetical protein AVDCRST_MAG58-3055 [uncultured Rubrobacteraceae bacterium]|uniref:Uncharacterized protein n=1 Tax=uncultured Rubrobacteraceae bacterium TaxID=349277 RepID=A0A6J4RCG1_9ACTN|nr:MAG: hypothetical protein AVDCRST_MAG58-3055 [uncultured Rubrobacteraceae bacterium]
MAAVPCHQVSWIGRGTLGLNSCHIAYSYASTFRDLLIIAPV